MRSSHVLVAVAALLGGCATVPATAPADAAKATKDVAAAPYCLRETGTRISLPEGHCVPAPSRTYTREQLRATGAVTTGEALRLLGY